MEGKMANKTVRDVMVPLEEYATVSADSTLFEAVVALERCLAAWDPNRHRHRAILVFDEKKRVVGKLSHLDVLQALEPKYQEIGDTSKLSRAGFSPEFLRSMLEKFALWDKPLADICGKAARMKVGQIMYTPTEGEYVDEGASLTEAIHQLVMGHHQSLLVTRKGDIVGILRLTDVFREISELIKTCGP